MMTDAGSFILYLFYGLAFFTIGAAITSRDLRFSDLKVAKVLWIFACFAYVHGLNEWYELFLKMNFQHLPGEYLVYLLSGRILLLGLSFGLLLWFGIELQFLKRNFKRPWLLITLMIATVSLGPALSSFFYKNFGVFDFFLRNFIAFPGAILSGIGLVRYSSTVANLNIEGSKNLKNAGYAIMVYGVFAGIYPSGWYVLGLPVEILRAISAILILHSIMRALQIFNVEHKRKIEAQLRLFTQSEKMVSLGKLSAGIAHEINTPLANVLLNVEMLEKNLSKCNQTDFDHQKRIKAIKRNLGRASKIASELLFFSHNRETDMETMNLNEVIRKTFQLIESRQNLYDFHIDLANTPEIDGIPWKVEEVLLNLLMNAMEASPPGARIEVRTQIVADRLCCTIQDHGSGIRDEDLSFVFDPFFTTKEPGEGTGLGMSICFGIMELHRGEIIINSKVNEGTVIQLFFPIPERSNQ